VPEADVPRSLTCELVGHAFTDVLQPGMQVTLGGVLLPVQQHSSQLLRLGLVQQQQFAVSSIQFPKAPFAAAAAAAAAGGAPAAAAAGSREERELQQQLQQLLQQQGLYETLAAAVSPSVFGLLDVKKALLLQQIGGVPRRKQDGGSIRGDIHLLLLGDPGLAKSQLLKQAAAAAARAVYAAASSSSSSGLTAAVLRDPKTKETVLEGGALVLADKGLCCIDEFDKVGFIY
ncbi:Protein PROLIFERA, related, partial [Eimeria necatrix]